MSKGAIFLLIVAAMFPALFIIGLVVKLWEIRKARRWPYTEGTIIFSGVESARKRRQHIGRSIDNALATNEPRIEYEYQVAGKKHRCRRITIAETIGPMELQSYLTRFPVGKSVTVYYDPANPQKAILERELPMGMLFVGFACWMFMFIGGPLVAYLAYANGLTWLKSHLTHPERAPFVAAVTGLGLLVLLFAAAFSWMVWRASRWPVARGRVISAEAEAFADPDPGIGPVRTLYRPSVVYTYQVDGLKFVGDRVMLGVAVASTFSSLARRMAERYPVGSEVDVHYNPAGPGESVLRPYSWWHFVPWLIAAGIFVLAWVVATGRM